MNNEEERQIEETDDRDLWAAVTEPFGETGRYTSLRLVSLSDYEYKYYWDGPSSSVSSDMRVWIEQNISEDHADAIFRGLRGKIRGIWPIEEPADELPPPPDEEWQGWAAHLGEFHGMTE